MLVFEERGKPEYPEKNLSEQGREPTTNSSDVMEVTISDHYLIYAVFMNLKVRKLPKTTITTRSFKNCTAEDFAKDRSEVHWNTLDLKSVDKKVEVYNDLFLTCLESHDPIKTVSKGKTQI